MELKYLLLLVLFVQAAVCEDEEPVEKVKEEFKPPQRPEGDVYFAESFQDPEDEVMKRWIKSEATKDGADADVAKYDGMSTANLDPILE